MIYKAGLDIGSRFTKCVLTQNDNVIARSYLDTGTNIEATCKFALEKVLETAKLDLNRLTSIITTGYGRRSFPGSDKFITEITSAGLGAYHSNQKRESVIIDIGGQDTKIIEINSKGEVIDFLMNDKCAAGTGKFLEIMSKTLETDIAGLDELANNSINKVNINSTCSVFAESEVISLISKGALKEDIASGLIDSISQRIISMFRHFEINKDIIITGGGAKINSLIKNIYGKLNKKIIVPEYPDFITAYGAAISQNP